VCSAWQSYARIVTGACQGFLKVCFSRQLQLFSCCLCNTATVNQLPSKSAGTCWIALPKLLKPSAFSAAKPLAAQLMPVFMSACSSSVKENSTDLQYVSRLPHFPQYPCRPASLFFPLAQTAGAFFSISACVPAVSLSAFFFFAQPAGAYACTSVAPDCGTGPGKPCCPFAYKISTNPPLNRTGCADKLYCNYDFTPAVAATELKLELLPASVPGTCEANAADCGKFGKGCCIATGPSATSISCGARWEETGQRGYCADPFDSNNSAGPQPAAGGVSGRRRVLLKGGSNGSSGNSSRAGAGSSSSSSSKRKASYKELVCTPCPPRSDNVANNPSKYWPC
jgi:hypothetical protein